ncbi:MAG: Queuosine biosynthesis protein QueC [Pseudomonadota bacterium]|jgi:hypothetical protein
MQRIEQRGAIGPLAGVAARLFEWGSQWPLPARADVPAIWQGFLSAVGAHAGCSIKAAGAAIAAPTVSLDPARAVVLFSGGKDGLAVALKLRSEGMFPVLLHVRGINGGAYVKQEAEAARAVADIAEFPFRELKVKLAGKSDHIENPTKNLALACLAASLAVAWGAGVVALGLQSEDRWSTNPRCGLSDNIDVALPGCAAIEAMVPGLRLIPASFATDASSLVQIATACPEALPAISSCMTGARFKRSVREANERRFGVTLLPGRCGSCYKCAIEAAVLAAMDGQVMPKPWADHCVEKLRRGAQIVGGLPSLPSVDDAFKVFMSPGLPWRHALGRP